MWQSSCEVSRDRQPDRGRVPLDNVPLALVCWRHTAAAGLHHDGRLHIRSLQARRLTRIHSPSYPIEHCSRQITTTSTLLLLPLKILDFLCLLPITALRVWQRDIDGR